MRHLAAARLSCAPSAREHVGLAICAQTHLNSGHLVCTFWMHPLIARLGSHFPAGSPHHALQHTLTDLLGKAERLMRVDLAHTLERSECGLERDMRSDRSDTSVQQAVVARVVSAASMPLDAFFPCCKAVSLIGLVERQGVLPVSFCSLIMMYVWHLSTINIATHASLDVGPSSVCRYDRTGSK